VNDSIETRILYQNSSCIAINKLKGEAVEGAKKGMTDLPRLLAGMLAEDVEMSGKTGMSGNAELSGKAVVEAVHRLDVPVTGCALFALDKKALVFLNSAFNTEDDDSSSVERIYWAVLEKPPAPLPESGVLVHWIETSSSMNKSFAYDNLAPGRKKASLYYKILGEGQNYLFAEIKLLSGRHHQIRAQLAGIGFHIKGDLKYGAKRSEKKGGIRLHARSLSFPNPLNKDETIHITADPPEMDNLWEQFSHKGTKIH